MLNNLDLQAIEFKYEERQSTDLYALIVATASASPGASKIASWDLAVERNFDDSENHETADKVAKIRCRCSVFSSWNIR